MKRALLLLALSLLWSLPLRAGASEPWFEKTKISGYAFGDLYWFAADHDPDVEDQNGFWFRRLYLTLDHQLNPELAVRLRLEANSPGDFTTNTTLEPFVKDAYLTWKHSGRELLFGISPTPTWEVIESVWGYRSVEKTPADLQALGAAREFGIALKGSFDQGGKLRYHLTLGNGAGVGSETNQSKKASVSLGFYPNDSFLFELYGDQDDRPGASDRVTVQGFAAWRSQKGRVGLQYTRQEREVGPGARLELELASVFGVCRLGERLALLLRYDRMFDPNPEGAKIPYLRFDPTAESQLLLAGLDWKLHASVSVIPNVEYVIYDAPASAAHPGEDLVPRLTLLYQF